MKSREAVIQSFSRRPFGRRTQRKMLKDKLVPLAGIEPALLAELDFESSVVYYIYLFLNTFSYVFVCMCKRLCKFLVFLHSFQRP